MVVRDEIAGLETIRRGRSVFIRKTVLGDVTATPSVQLLLVHGTCSSESVYAALWDPLDRLLLQQDDPRAAEQKKKLNRIDCIAYDMVGCGQSPVVREWEAYSNEEQAADLQAVVQRHVDRTLPLILVGHSYAPSIFLPWIHQQLQQPQPVDHLLAHLQGFIFLGTGVRSPHLHHQDGGHPIMRLPLFLLKCLQGSLSQSFVDLAVHPDQKALRTTLLKENNRNDMYMANGYHRHHVWATTSDLEEVRDRPVLVVHGVDDHIVNLACGQHLADQFPHSNLVALERTGHLLMLEKPNEVAEAIVTFLVTSVVLSC